jgi:hypothetical protein
LPTGCIAISVSYLPTHFTTIKTTFLFSFEETHTNSLKSANLWSVLAALLETIQTTIAIPDCLAYEWTNEATIFFFSVKPTHITTIDATFLDSLDYTDADFLQSTNFSSVLTTFIDAVVSTANFISNFNSFWDASGATNDLSILYSIQTTLFTAFF